MSLMGTTKHNFAPHGAGPRTPGHDEHDPPSADSPDLPALKKPFRSPQSSSSPAPKRTKTHQGSRTPTTLAGKNLKPTSTAQEHRRSAMKNGRIPLADLRSTQGQRLWPTKDPKCRESHASINDGAGEVSTRNDEVPTQRFDSDSDSFEGGDLFTSTDQQQLSVLRNKERHDYDETTAEF